MKPKLSIITVVSIEKPELIGDCFRSVFEGTHEYSFEYFVVSNSAPADLIQMIAREFPGVILIQNSQNLGFARANNQGIQKAKGEYILLLNPDTEVQNQALEKMVRFMEENPDVGILGPKLLFPDGRIQKEVTTFPTLLSMILWLFRVQKIPFFRKIPPLSSYLLGDFDYEKTQEVDHVMGSAFLVRKKVFDQIGLLDEDFFFWFEETDFCKRAKEVGWKVVYYPEAQVAHHVGGSTRQFSPFRIQSLWNKSLETYFRKHGKPWEVRVLRFFFPFSYLVAILAWMVKRTILR